MEQTANIKPRILQGIIVSTKMQKTVVVEVKSYTKHPKYKKYIARSKKYLAHDESGAHKEGDKVEISECRPISRRKSFTVITK